MLRGGAAARWRLGARLFLGACFDTIEKKRSAAGLTRF
jgi:hypothetical protein